SFKHEKDTILKTLAHDFLNRRMWKHMDDNKENEEAIQKIYNDLTEEEIKYFTLKTSVQQGAYQESRSNLGDQIYILNEKNEVISLTQHSSIVHSLVKSSMKIDPKIFYRPYER